jgi:hypothetical protein
MALIPAPIRPAMATSIPPALDAGQRKIRQSWHTEWNTADKNALSQDYKWPASILPRHEMMRIYGRSDKG